MAGIQGTDGAADAQALPDISGSALASLTARIEKDLQNGARAKQGKGQGGKDVKKEKGKKVTADEKSVGGQSHKPSAAPASVTTSQSITKTEKKSNKRERNGERKPASASAAAHSAKNELLEKEIYAIGGSADDYDLIANVDSDSEVEGADDDVDEASLRNDLAGMLKGFDPSYVIPKLPVAKKQKDESTKKATVTEKRPDKQSVAKSAKEESVTGSASDGKQTTKEKKGKKEKKQEQKAAIEATLQTQPQRDEQKVPAKPVVMQELTNAKMAVASKPKNSKFIIEPRSDWHATELPPITVTKSAKTVPRFIIDRVHEYANSLLETENEVYAASQDSSTAKFYTTIVTTGTLSDKTSALTLAIQESPLHNKKALDNLIGLAKKRSRAQAVDVLKSLKDLFSQGDILPSNRRLRAFSHQPALLSAFAEETNWHSAMHLPNGVQKAHLVYWAFEDYVKTQYFEILKILEVWCNDEIEFSRSRAVSYVYELLKDKPEQEANLLRLLVNKLGDPNRKIASRASYLLLQLEQAHPLMKMTIISAIEADILFRPGQSQHAKYYAIITLNQTILSRADENVAEKLLDIYFSLFVAILKPGKDAAAAKKAAAGQPPQKKNKKAIKREKEAAKGQAQEEELREKLTAGLLTGVNRAYPFANADSARLSEHIDTLFRITHSSNITTSIQALILIQQLTSVHQIAADRFYRTLYESLLDPRLVTTSKQSLYLNLLFKSLKADVKIKRVKAFVKRLVQVLSLHNPSFVCGVFFLIRELEKAFPGLSSLVDEPEADEDDDEEVFRDVPEEDEEGSTAVPTNDASDDAFSHAQRYDARKRDPEHSNAERSCLWELIPYLSHYHPSVAVNANHLHSHTPMSGKADLSLHTLIHFLDRFVYRNPKQATPMRGASIMQPLAGAGPGERLVSGAARRVEEPVNREAFLRKKGDEVAAEDAFFHDYFSRLGDERKRKQLQKEKEQKKKKGKKAGADGEDTDEDAGDSDAESEIWQALVDSRPELEGAEGSEDDLDLDELESAMESDEEMEDAEEEGEGDEGVIFNDESDRSEGEDADEEEEEQADEAAAAASVPDDDDDDEQPFGLDASDDEALVDSDAELPSDIEAEMEREMAAQLAKQAEEKPEDGRKKRRKLKHLPTFASYDDYAKLLEGEDEGM
ncbi:hypothetical protein KEM52_004144 [Ascosphaera acerosa]|nr:hypothetical protein KEM52_004144 [Ascosphaera acerosa]